MGECGADWRHLCTEPAQGQNT